MHWGLTGDTWHHYPLFYHKRYIKSLVLTYINIKESDLKFWLTFVYEPFVIFFVGFESYLQYVLRSSKCDISVDKW